MLRRYTPVVLLSFCFALFLSGCGGLLPFIAGSTSPPLTTYDLHVDLPSVDVGGKRINTRLAIKMPEALEVLSSMRILLRPSRYVVGYLSGGQWADRLPRLIQESLFDVILSQNIVKGVIRSGDLQVSDSHLATDVKDFSIVFTDSGSYAHVEIYATLVRDSKGYVSESRNFEAWFPVEYGRSVDDGISDGHVSISALHGAFSAVLQEMIPWIIEELRK